MTSINPAVAGAEGVARFPRWAMAGGVLNALLASWLLAMWHDSFALPEFAILLIAVAYVAVAALAAAATARYYWRQAKVRSRFTLEELMLTWGAAWVWAPAVVLLMRRDLWWAPVLAALAAAIPACTMRWMQVKSGRGRVADGVAERIARPIFTETLQPIPQDWRGMVIAACVYAGCAAYFDGDSLFACSLAAVAAFLFAGQRAATLDDRAERLTTRERARGRLVWSAMLAVLVTMLALLQGPRKSGAVVGVAEASAAKVKRPDVNEPGGLGNYHSVILWPEKPEKQILVPADLLPATTLDQQKTIRFTGEYWYFEAPADGPGAHAHVAHGNPMDVSIRTLNANPLMMEAHQGLGKAIRLSSVRAMDVTVLNRDNEPGALSLGVMLTDSAAANRMAINLGVQPIASSEPEHFTIKKTPVTEKLRFVIPAQARARRFDGITVMILPGANRMHSGSRVAIDHFDLAPR